MVKIQILLLAVKDVEGNSHEIFEVSSSNVLRTEKLHLSGKMFQKLWVKSCTVHPSMKQEC
jgi:hypothetical protein